MASPHFFSDLDWRVKFVIGAALIAGALVLIRPPQRRPVRFAVAMFGLQLGTLIAIRGVVAVDGEQWWQFALPFALVVVPAIFFAVVLTRMRWWRRSGFTPRRDWRSPELTAILALTLVLPLLGLAGRGALRMTTGLLAFQVAFLVIGVFVEEVIYRGLILAALLRYGAPLACLGSGLLFGLSHIDNLFLPGSDIGVVYQIFEGALIGVLFGAVRLGMNTIWPVLAVHALYDFILVLAYGHAVPVEPTLGGFAVVTAVNVALAAGALALISRSRYATDAAELAV